MGNGQHTRSFLIRNNMLRLGKWTFDIFLVLLIFASKRAWNMSDLMTSLINRSGLNNLDRLICSSLISQFTHTCGRREIFFVNMLTKVKTIWKGNDASWAKNLKVDLNILQMSLSCLLWSFSYLFFALYSQ